MEPVTQHQLDTDGDVLFIADGNTTPGTTLLERSTRPDETVLSCVYRGNGRWHLVTVSFHPLGNAGVVCSYLTVWQHRDADYVELGEARLTRWVRLWGPSETGMAVGDLTSEPPFPPIDPDPEEE
jgi:hypothetical protein